MMIDPFYKDIEVVRFKSTNYFENQLKGQDDFPIKLIVQNSMVQKSSTSVDSKTFIWAQFPKELVMVRLKDFYQVDQDDSDVENNLSDDED